MIRIVALNDIGDNSECDSKISEIQIAKEAQETIAESEYLRALSLMSSGESELAQSLFTELLNTQVLNEISKEDIKLWTILYNCYKNLALINEEKEIYDAALSKYISAIQIDNTDINTLFRMGRLSLKLRRFEWAEYAFESCLQQNNKHWAAANGLLTVYIHQNNILAAYGIALKLITQRQVSKLVDETISDIVSRFSSFIPFCEKLYGKLPDDLTVNSSGPTVFNASQTIEANIIPVHGKTNFPDIQAQHMNFYSIGEFILNYLRENSFEDICGNKNENMSNELASEARLKGEDYNENIDTHSNIDGFIEGFSNAAMDIFETDAEGNLAKSDEDAGKAKPRRRCSDLRLLEQWGWHKNRKTSSRRKAQQDRTDINTTLSGFLRTTFGKFMEATFEETGNISATRKSDELECKLCQSSITVESFIEKTSSDFEIFCDKQIKGNRMDFLRLNFSWLKYISEMWLSILPSEIRNVFIELYIIHIEFFGLPSWNMPEASDFHDSVRIQLLFMELQYDKSIKSQSILPKIWMETFDNLQFLFGCTLKEPGDCVEIYTIRMLNLEFLKYSANVDNDKCLKTLDFVMEFLHTKSDEYSIHLPNLNSCCITKNNWINKRDEIERKTKLNQIPILFASCQWSELCKNVKEQLANKINIGGDPLGLHDYKNLNELLLQCLWMRKEFEDCLVYAESFLNFSTQNYLQESNSLWIDAIVFAMSYIDGIMASEGSEIITVLMENCSRLIQNLVNILSYQFDEEMEKKIYIEDEIKMRRTWIILHRILLREETLNHSVAQGQSEDDSLPMSFMLLFTAHENIGKKQTCTSDNGEFLQYIIQTILPNLYAPIYNFCRNHALEYIEQITYCMYGFPPKKARSRHLDDHSSKLIDLTWENAIDIFDIYAPESLPEFNSYKVESITSDMEQFLHKILGLFPKDFDYTSRIQDVNNFISGFSNNSSSNSETLQLPFKIKNIYYLIADYYFKSGDFSKAIKYYINDLAVNSTRFDSWAGISLSKASIIETKLNGLHQTDPSLFVLECEEVIRCFGKCISLVQNHILIWIEYGSFAYSISSYCTRNIKQFETDDSFWNRGLIEKKEKLLNIASNCFTVAATLQSSELTSSESCEEKWLSQYMLGKISEKKKEPPNVYLDYYLRASNFLYECNATYPIKLNHNNPTTLSVEALEVFYRTNAAIMKYLEKVETVPRQIGNMFKSVLKQLSNSPFAFNKAKIDGNCIYAIKRKPAESSDMGVNKKITLETSKAPREDQINSVTNAAAVPTVRRLSEESRATETITSSTNSSSSFSNTDTESDNSNNHNDDSNYTTSELEKIYMKVIRNLEECVIRFPEHYKSIYRLVSFYMNGPNKIRNLNTAENLLLSNYKTGVGNTIDGLFFDRKTNNIFNGIWRIPSSEIDRPGSFSTHLVKCVDILIRMLKNQLNYKLLIDIILQLHKSPDNDKRYIMDSDRIRLYEAAINYCQEIMRTLLSKHEADGNDKELLNLLVDIYKIQKKCYKYVMQKDTWFSSIFVDVYLAYIKKKVDVLPSHVNYADLAVKLCHQEINHKKMVEKHSRLSMTNSPGYHPSFSQVRNIQQISPALPDSNRLMNDNGFSYVPPSTFSADTQLFGSNILDPMLQENPIFLEYCKQFMDISKNDEKSQQYVQPTFNSTSTESAQHKTQDYN